MQAVISRKKNLNGLSYKFLLGSILCRTISELNAKTDQISEGLAALAQIYIDNYPFTYRSNHEGQKTFLNPSHGTSS